MSTLVLETGDHLGAVALGGRGTRGAAVTARASRAGGAARADRPLRLVPSPPAPAVAAPAPLRLTRRGRAVVRLVVVLVGVLAVAAVVLGLGRAAKADAGVRQVEVGYHVVQPGETLWSIAGDVAPGADRRDTVARIAELNALETASVQAGRRIAVPLGR